MGRAPRNARVRPGDPMSGSRHYLGPREGNPLSTTPGVWAPRPQKVGQETLVYWSIWFSAATAANMVAITLTRTTGPNSERVGQALESSEQTQPRLIGFPGSAQR